MLHLRSKTSLRIATAGLWLLCTSMFVWAVAVRVSIPEPVPQTSASLTHKSAAGGGRDSSAMDAQPWDTLWARRFQRALFDPPPAVPAAETPQTSPPPPIELVATAAEDGGGSAFITDDKGVTSMVAVGATITAGGTSAKLVRVFDDRIELEQEGKVITIPLKMAKKE